MNISAAASAGAQLPARARERSQYRRVLRLLVMAGDLLLINFAFIIAYQLRYVAEIGGNVIDENFVDLSFYLPLQAGISVSLLAIYRISGVYRAVGQRSFLAECWDVVQGTTFGMTLFFGVVFLVRGFAYSRGLFLIAWALTVALLVLLRLATRVVQAVLRQRGIGVRRVLVVGGEPLGHFVMHVLATEPGLGYKVEGFVDGSTSDVGRFRCLGTIDDLSQVVREYQIDDVIVALPTTQAAQVAGISECCAQEGVGFKIVPDLFELTLGLSQVDVEDLRGIPVVGMREVSIKGTDLLLKRAMDIAIAGTALFLFAPVAAACALAIKLTSPGPIYFHQTRLGKDGRPFEVLKFRSMRINAEHELDALKDKNEATGPIFKMKQDPRLTPAGRWMRRLSLDELPQLWNVLRGEMSLVGPRPPLPSEVARYQEWHKKRLKVAPGMTGLWQVKGRSELPFDEMVLLDIYYIESWSLGLDVQILLRTLPAVISGRGAY